MGSGFAMLPSSFLSGVCRGVVSVGSSRAPSTAEIGIGSFKGETGEYWESLSLDSDNGAKELPWRGRVRLLDGRRVLDHEKERRKSRAFSARLDELSDSWRD